MAGGPTILEEIFDNTPAMPPPRPPIQLTLRRGSTGKQTSIPRPEREESARAAVGGDCKHYFFSKPFLIKVHAEPLVLFYLAASLQGIEASLNPLGYYEEVTQGRPEHYQLGQPQSGLPSAAPPPAVPRMASKESARFKGESSRGTRPAKSSSIRPASSAFLRHANVDLMKDLSDHLEMITATEIGFAPRTSNLIRRVIESCQVCDINTVVIERFYERWLNAFQGYTELKTLSEGPEVTSQRAELQNYEDTLAKTVKQIERKARFLESRRVDQVKGRPCRSTDQGVSLENLMAEMTNLQETKANLDLVIENIKQEIEKVLAGVDFSSRDANLQDFVECMNRYIDQFLDSQFLQQFDRLLSEL